MIRRILDFLYPMKCPFCGRVTSDGICSECKESVKWIKEPYCMKCGKPILHEWQEYCHDCRQEKHSYESGRGIWVHMPPVSDAVYAFKYQNKRIYGEIFAKEMWRVCSEYLDGKNIECIIPIPLSRSRKRKRGYNQTEILGKYLSAYMNIPMKTDVLVRTKNTRPQKELNSVQRKKNISGAFRVKDKPMEHTVLLLDDIYTTGSTLDEAASTLKKSGVKKVYFLAVSIGQGY